MLGEKGLVKRGSFKEILISFMNTADKRGASRCPVIVVVSLDHEYFLSNEVITFLGFKLYQNQANAKAFQPYCSIQMVGSLDICIWCITSSGLGQIKLTYPFAL